MKNGFIRIETQKTGEAVELPVHGDFSSFLKTQEQGIGKAPVFPTLSKTKVNGRSGLSLLFRDIMQKAKIKERVATKSGEAGRTRYSKGLQEVRQKLTAHSDDTVHKAYSHLERETFKTAVDKIPSVL
jgi:hypothetical protein